MTAPKTGERAVFLHKTVVTSLFLAVTRYLSSFCFPGALLSTSLSVIPLRGSFGLHSIISVSSSLFRVSALLPHLGRPHVYTLFEQFCSAQSRLQTLSTNEARLLASTVSLRDRQFLNVASTPCGGGRRGAAWTCAESASTRQFGARPSAVKDVLIPPYSDSYLPNLWKLAGSCHSLNYRALLHVPSYLCHTT